MRIDAIDDTEARCSAKGVERTVSLFMLMREDLAPGDHVLVHVGYAIKKISEAEALSTWELLDEALAQEEQVANA
jgi:hydrogenase expression/formation protein HypC